LIPVQAGSSGHAEESNFADIYQVELKYKTELIEVKYPTPQAHRVLRRWQRQLAKSK
jgi:hypothetical protein